MSEPAQEPVHSRPCTARVMALGILVCATAISCQSFWIDEAGTAYKAAMPTFGDWWRSMRVEANANLQLPLYNLFAWAWEKLSGTNEFALRAGNALWFLAGLLVIARALAGTPRRRRGILLVLLASPFAWYYLNEARPYAMQLSLGLIVFGALYRLGFGADSPRIERRWMLALCAGSVLLAASGMLAMLWLGAYLGAAMLSAPRDRMRQLGRAYRVWWTTLLVLLLFTGLYYLWTLKIGIRATNVGTTDVRNLLFVPYELLGFSGLGPGRLAIRTGGLQVFRPWLPWLAIYAAVLLLVLVAGWRQMKTLLSSRTRWWWMLGFALVAGFILAVGVAVRFRVLGRHFSPVLPLFIFILGTGVTALWERKTWMSRAILIAFAALSLISCGQLRFSERHDKDDYRGAAALAREAVQRGQIVWWNAEEVGATVYHLSLAQKPDVSAAAIFVINPGRGFEQNLPRPDVVFTSKPDVYDGAGNLADYLARNGFQPATNLNAFIVWQSSTNTPAGSAQH